ncbi:MAG: alkaline phosphatase [Saprospiraceae bacterium]
MFFFKRIGLLLIAIVATGLGPTAEGSDKSDPARPRNVILMIGDGMGLTQVTAAMYASPAPLHMERMPVTGLITTHSAKDLITDSAAGATAFACGVKTYNGVIGMTAKGKPCVNIAEMARERGMAVGITVTCSATHATPAAFIAHARDRGLYEEIALWYMERPVDFLAAGGAKYFERRATDRRNLLAELVERNYAICRDGRTALTLDAADPSRPFWWFASDEEPPGVLQGRDYLPDAVQIACAYLKRRSDKGFFLMVEGSQIDWACHKNDDKASVAEVLDFDAAVGAALRFAEADGQTLVIVTADHETGGMAVVQGSTTDSLYLKFAGKQHTASMAPVFAFGPGSERFHGLYENTDIFYKILLALGW